MRALLQPRGRRPWAGAVWHPVLPHLEEMAPSVHCLRRGIPLQSAARVTGVAGAHLGWDSDAAGQGGSPQVLRRGVVHPSEIHPAAENHRYSRIGGPVRR